VFTLHDVEGLSASAISELLGIKLNTVYSRLRRARAQFRGAVARHRAREGRLRGEG
jgi:RNA polymerase sigma-70 factor (ECF subfamily)